MSKKVTHEQELKEAEYMGKLKGRIEAEDEAKKKQEDGQTGDETYEKGVGIRAVLLKPWRI